MKKEKAYIRIIPPTANTFPLTVATFAGADPELSLARGGEGHPTVGLQM